MVCAQVGCYGVFLAVIVLVVLWILFFSPSTNKYVREYQKNHPKPLSSIDELKDNFETGDLIFLSGNTFNEKCIKTITRCGFSHVAMIVKRPNGVVMLFECDLGQRARDGVRLIHFDQKLKYYRGSRVGGWMKLKSSRQPQQHIIERIVGENVGHGMVKSFHTYFLANYPESLLYEWSRDTNRTFCSELIADTYQKLALMKGDHIPSYYTPKHFLEKTAPLMDDVELEDVVLFKF